MEGKCKAVPPTQLVTKKHINAREKGDLHNVYCVAVCWLTDRNIINVHTLRSYQKRSIGLPHKPIF